MDNKTINEQVNHALDCLQELDDHIDNALALTTPGSFLHDTLLVVQRNSGLMEMKLKVANDITEGYID